MGFRKTLSVPAALIRFLLILLWFPAALWGQVPDVGPGRCVESSYGCGSGGSYGGGAEEAGRAIGRAIRELLFGSGQSSVPAPMESAQHQRANQALALNEEGVALAHQQRFAEALEKFRQAAALDPSNRVAQANLAGSEAGFFWQDGNLEAALMKARQALAFNDHPTWRKLVSDIEGDFARHQAEKQAAARASATVMNNVNSLIASLGAQGTPDFDGRSTDSAARGGLAFMAGPSAAPVADQTVSAAINDPSVVDLRDATTLSVDPNRVKGERGAATPQNAQGLQFMTSLDRTVVPTPQEQARREADLQRRAAAARRHAEWQREWQRQAQEAAFQEEIRRALLDNRLGFSPEEERRAELLYLYVIKPRAEADLKEEMRRWREMQATLDAIERRQEQDPIMGPALQAVRAEMVRRALIIADAKAQGLVLPQESDSELLHQRDFDLLYPKDPRTAWPGPKNPQAPSPNPIPEERRWQEFAAEKARTQDLQKKLLALFDKYKKMEDDFLTDLATSPDSLDAFDKASPKPGQAAQPNRQ